VVSLTPRARWCQLRRESGRGLHVERRSRASRRGALNHSLARALAALFGTMPVALAFGVVLASALPLPPPTRILFGYFSVFPTWVTLCLRAFLAASALRAWLGLLVLAALLGAAMALERWALAGALLPGAP
jgi:hypothetical protein